MKWLTIEYIKENSKIDFDCEDAALELYGNSAENTVLQVTRRTLANIQDMNDGNVPPELYHAALMLTDLGYLHRNPITSTNMSVVPYTFDMKIADWMRYDKNTDLQAERDTLLGMMSDVESNLDFAYGEISDPTTEQATLYTSLKTEISEANEKYAAIENPTEKICTKLRTAVSIIKDDCEMAFGE